MILASIRAYSLTIPFTESFSHAAAERNATETVWIEAHSPEGTAGFGEGCPRAYVTGESLQSAGAFITRHRPDWLKTIQDVATLAGWVSRHRRDINANPSAWAAVELALLDLIGKEAGRSVESLLGLPELGRSFRYTAVLGDSDAPRFEARLAQCVQAGFRDFKIKLSGEPHRDRAKTRALISAGISPQTVRADANNLWRDAGTALRSLEALEFPFVALEEPLAAGNYAGMSHIAHALDTRIILDESLLRLGQLSEISDSADRWIVNLRVSKMGGIMRSLELIGEVRRLGCKLILGAHVGETSLLTRAALTLANSASDSLLAQEGAFGTHLLRSDVCNPPVMFGRAGVLDWPTRPRAFGFGLALAVPAGYFSSLDTS